MQDEERLRIVFKRLIEEMGYYDEEFAGWTELAHNAGLDAAARLIEEAQKSIRSGNLALKTALELIR
ncbi:MAG: hypothetical protein LBQ00_05750 [Syntrophobacterales bacterium]|jgi:hypothetical protein|nr:hypothetical protein [Syntrophobacterales bacterium]